MRLRRRLPAERIHIADECARTTLDICMSKMLLSNRESAGLLDILFVVRRRCESQKLCGGKYSAVSDPAVRGQAVPRDISCQPGRASSLLRRQPKKLNHRWKELQGKRRNDSLLPRLGASKVNKTSGLNFSFPWYYGCIYKKTSQRWL
jgi:hypothetical protein